VEGFTDLPSRDVDIFLGRSPGGVVGLLKRNPMKKGGRHARRKYIMSFGGGVTLPTSPLRGKKVPRSQRLSMKRAEQRRAEERSSAHPSFFAFIFPDETIPAPRMKAAKG